MLTQPITEYALAFNFAQSLQQARFAQEYRNIVRTSGWHDVCTLSGALSLKEGKRPRQKKKYFRIRRANIISRRIENNANNEKRRMDYILKRTETLYCAKIYGFSAIQLYSAGSFEAFLEI